MMHNLEFNLLYHSENAKKITYVTPLIFSQKKGDRITSKFVKDVILIGYSKTSNKEI